MNIGSNNINNNNIGGLLQSITQSYTLPLQYNEENIFQENSPVDFEQVLYQALVNEGKHIRVNYFIYFI